MKLSFLYFIALLIVFCIITVPSNAQNSETLTNAKVISMVKAGLPKTAIIASIQNKAADFNTSTDAMIALKKQGVPDDVITAMVSKGTSYNPPKVQSSKTENVKSQYAAFVPVPPANPKDCKMVTAKAMNGQDVTLVETASKLGKFRMARVNGKITISYDTKQFFNIVFSDEKNQANLRIDSVRFGFADHKYVTVRTINSFGKLANQNDELQPTIKVAHLMFILEPGSLAEHYFTQIKMTGFLVYSERNGRYGDQLDDGQQDKFLTSFNCIPQ